MRKDYTNPAEKKRDFWIGVGLWFGLNILLALCSWGVNALLLGLSSTRGFDSSFEIYSFVLAILSALPLIINIGLIIYFAFTRSQIALGMLAGFGIGLLIVVCLGVFFAVVCFVVLSANGV